MKIENFIYEKGNDYECQVFGKADSRVTRRHLQGMLFAVEDCMRIEQDEEVKENE